MGGTGDEQLDAASSHLSGPALPDAELAGRCRRLNPRDQDAWRALWNLYARLVYSIVKNNLPGEPGHIVDELVADTFLRLLGAIHRYDPERARLSTFVLTVGRSVALDYRRSRKRHFSEELYTLEYTSEPAVSADESVIGLVAARLRANLTAPQDPRDRLVFEELLKGFRIQEIVKRHHISVKAVRRVRRNTLAQAKEILDKILPA